MQTCLSLYYIYNVCLHVFTRFLNLLKLQQKPSVISTQQAQKDRRPISAERDEDNPVITGWGEAEQRGNGRIYADDQSEPRPTLHHLVHSSGEPPGGTTSHPSQRGTMPPFC